MMRRLLFLLVIILLSSSVYAQENIIGKWSGDLRITPAYSLRLILNLSKEKEQLVGTLDSPDQGGKDLPIDSISFVKDQFSFSSNTLGIHYSGILQSDSIIGTFTQNGYHLPLTLKKMEEEKESTKDLPYYTEEVRVIHPEIDLELAGTFSKPTGKGKKYPAVLLIAGSGPMNRDSKIFQHSPLAEIADHLTRSGIAVLRYDKRGIGSSEGNFPKSSLSDFISDAVTMLEYLREYPDIDPDQVGIIGHSEGGMIAQVIAAEYPDLPNFIVLLATPTTSTIEILTHQNKTLIQDYIDSSRIEEFENECRNLFKGISKENRTRSNDSILLTAFNEKVLSMSKPEFKTTLTQMLSNPETIKGNLNIYESTYFQELIKHIPENYLGKISIPLLALIGEKDTQVPPEANITPIINTLPDNSTIKIFPNLNHIFIESETGLFTEYPYLKGSFSKDVLEYITIWIKNGYTVPMEDHW